MSYCKEIHAVDKENKQIKLKHITKDNQNGVCFTYIDIEDIKDLKEIVIREDY
jgi:hypothetical protein